VKLDNLLNPGVLAIVAMITAVALSSWIPVAVWVAYVVLLTIYAKGRDDERFEREHPTPPTLPTDPPE
jgi:hypothetical protein